MAQVFSLAWTPGEGATNQLVQYRVKNTGTWVVAPGVSPVNPLSSGINSATVTGLSTNTVYQFQVVSNCCPNVTGLSSIQEGIIFADAGIGNSVSTGVITVSASVVLPQVDTINYKLFNSVPTQIQARVATGTSSSASFSAVTSGAYTVKYQYQNNINGVVVSSDDAAQTGALFVSGTITVP